MYKVYSDLSLVVLIHRIAYEYPSPIFGYRNNKNNQQEGSPPLIRYKMVYHTLVNLIKTLFKINLSKLGYTMGETKKIILYSLKTIKF